MCLCGVQICSDNSVFPKLTSNPIYHPSYHHKYVSWLALWIDDFQAALYIYEILSHCDTCFSCVPLLLQFLSEVPVCDIAAGLRHSLAVTGEIH